MSEIFLSTRPQSSGTAAVPVALTGHVADPPASLDHLGQGDLLQGRVLGRDEAGRMLVKTDLGVLKIATPQMLPEGTEVTLQIRQAGARVQVLILGAQLPPAPAGGPVEPPPPQTEVFSRAPLPDAVVRSQPIQAVLQSPVSGAAPLFGLPSPIAPGSELTIRVLSVGPPASPTPTTAPPSTTAPTMPDIHPAPAGSAQGSRITTFLGNPAQGPGTAQALPGGQSGRSGRVSPNPGGAAATTMPGVAPRASAAPTAIPAATPAPAATPGPAGPSGGGSVVEMAHSLAAALGGAAGKAATVGAHPPRVGGAASLAAPAATSASSMTTTTSADKPAPPRVTGQVIGSTGTGQPVLRTALGIMTLALPTTLPTGSSLALEIIGFNPEAAPPASGAQARGGSPFGRPEGPGAPAAGAWDGQWVALGDLRLPVPETGPRLAPAILLFLAALKGGRLSGWLAGTERSDALAAAGADDGAPGGDVTAFARRIEAASGDWRLFFLPLLHAGIRSQVRLYLRAADDDRKASGPHRRDKATRFVIEAEISPLGDIQLDGLVAAGRFDLNFRSHARLRPDLRREVIDIYQAALRGEGWRGQLNFAHLDPDDRWLGTASGSREVLI